MGLQAGMIYGLKVFSGFEIKSYLTGGTQMTFEEMQNSEMGDDEKNKIAVCECGEAIVGGCCLVCDYANGVDDEINLELD